MRILRVATGLIMIGAVVGLVGCASQTMHPSTSSTVTSTPPSGTTTVPSPEPSTPLPVPSGTPGPSATPVDVVLVSYGNDGTTVYASGLVPQLAEESGTCTLTATDGATEKSASIAAVSAATSVNCGRIRIDVTPGTWTLTLSYASTSHSGRSAPTTVTVQ
ncbi:hypothetical protein ABCS02_09670 [Microbacterium sp. X-17]|uniref:hypothetical protein n=1 Tax=Microbacterium sp. X-17 TaxID=3144404 RepID=UPI0031F55089